MKLRLIIIMLLFSTISFAQNTQNLLKENGRKGKLYFYWGWNRSTYSNSDIKFKGNGYKFTLKNVKAKDRQNSFSANKFLNPGNLTIPQYNFRVGYYLTNNWDISFGIDHMKYVVQQGSTAQITGNINVGSEFDGVFDGEDILIQEGFLELEHTDGLNYVNVDLRHSNKIFNTKIVNLDFTKGFGGGFLYPRTDATLLNNERNDKFNVAGYGISAVAGLNLTFFKRFFIQSELKTGFIDLPNVKTTNSNSDSASQNFFFFQRNIVFGCLLYTSPSPRD